MPLIQVAGRKVHVQEMGEGPLVVLIHPLTYSLALWYLTVGPLLARTHRVLLYDLRGHGLSGPAAEGYDFVTLAADLRDLLEEMVGEAPVHVGGYSSGATLALRFAVEHPGWVRSVAAVDAPMPPFTFRQRAVEEGRDVEAIVADFPTEEVDVVKGSRREALRTNRNVRIHTETTLPEDFEAEEAFDGALRELERDVLLLYGDRSPFLDVGRRLAGLLPRADLQVVPGTHVIPFQQRSRVARALGAFWS